MAVAILLRQQYPWSIDWSKVIKAFQQLNTHTLLLQQPTCVSLMILG